jgi:DNA-directed RNA polymerase
MLHAQRLTALRRIPLSRLPCTCAIRSASTATATATNPTSYTTTPPTAEPQPLTRTRRPLYSLPPLPPLPTPLPLDADPLDLGFSTTNVSTIAGSAEQLAILSACLASGDTVRAEEIAKRIHRTWILRRANLSNAELPTREESLASLLPARVHTDFFKGYFSSAILPGTLIKRQRSEIVHKSEVYFNSLFSSSYETREEGRTVNLAIDKGTVATIFKGLTAIQAEGLPSWSRSSFERLLSLMRIQKITLGDVMTNAIWRVELPSYIGTVKEEAGLDMLEKRGPETSEWDSDWVQAVKDARKRIGESREATEQERQAAPGPAELKPTLQGDVSLLVTSTHLQNQEADVFELSVLFRRTT